ncbi:MAG: hypothetical protein HQK92_01090 [Nitrospirae bacterium]|nr:hypothetical protein [Nitrospirota bacterium]
MKCNCSEAVRGTYFNLVLLALMALLTVSCGSGSGGGSHSSSSTSSGSNTGWHNQGRDCLYCHNTDLETNRHLLTGGTVFKTVTVSDVDNVTDACNTTLYVQFVDSTLNVVYDSSNYTDTSSTGGNGTGNIFILSRKLSSLTGNYYVRLITSDGTVIGNSRSRHIFTSAYNNSNPSDSSNMYSCNACHTAVPQGGADGYLYPNINSSKCN